MSDILMDCFHSKLNTKQMDQALLAKLNGLEHELVTVARHMLTSASDPFSAVIRFLAERPEGASLPGHVMHYVLQETFGEREKVPGLIRILASQVHEIIRQSNVISIVNENPAIEQWGNY
jgi:hypothetical protein